MDVTEDGIVTMEFDLSAYAGATIDLGFRYVTDWATLYEGWFLLEATVGGTDILPSLAHVYPKASWMVTVIEKNTYSGSTSYQVSDMHLWMDYWGMKTTWVSSSEEIFLLISPMMELGVADYRFRTVRPGGPGPVIM